MIIVMQRQAGEQHIQAVVDFIHSRGLSEHISRGEERTIIGAVGDERVFEPREIEALDGVEKAMRVLQDWRIISREAQAEDTIIHVRALALGDGKLKRIQPQNTVSLSTADAVLLDPFFVPGNPYTQSAPISENQQIRALQSALHSTHQHQQPALVRIRDVRQIEHALQAEADILYLGGELMTNRVLQNEVGRLNVPVVLCKDKHHQVDDWLIAAEHIALKGNHHIILGEAGTLSLDRNAPYRLDVEAISKAKALTHLPVLANILRLPHAYMQSDTLFKLAVAAGVDAVIVAA